jgi:hypothetical protein
MISTIIKFTLEKDTIQQMRGQDFKSQLSYLKCSILNKEFVQFC